MHSEAKVDLQLWVCKTHSLFLYCYLLIIVLIIFHMNNCKPPFATPWSYSLWDSVWRHLQQENEIFLAAPYCEVVATRQMRQCVITDCRKVSHSQGRYYYAASTFPMHASLYCLGNIMATSYQIFQRLPSLLCFTTVAIAVDELKIPSSVVLFLHRDLKLWKYLNGINSMIIFKSLIDWFITWDPTIRED